MLHAAILLAATLLLATKSATVAFLTPTSHLTLHLKRPTQLYQSITLEVPTAKQKESATAQTSGSLVSGVNLVKNCVGAGIFSLNARVSRISTDPLMLGKEYMLTQLYTLYTLITHTLLQLEWLL